MPDMRLVVVSYDIADDKRRRLVSKAMENQGKRVQESVFECMLDERRLLKLQRKLRGLLDQDVDSVRFYHLCEGCRPRIELLGVGPAASEPTPVIIV